METFTCYVQDLFKEEHASVFLRVENDDDGKIKLTYIKPGDFDKALVLNSLVIPELFALENNVIDYILHHFSIDRSQIEKPANETTISDVLSPVNIERLRDSFYVKYFFDIKCDEKLAKEFVFRVLSAPALVNKSHRKKHFAKPFWLNVLPFNDPEDKCEPVWTELFPNFSMLVDKNSTHAYASIASRYLNEISYNEYTNIVQYVMPDIKKYAYEKTREWASSANVDCTIIDNYTETFKCADKLRDFLTNCNAVHTNEVLNRLAGFANVFIVKESRELINDMFFSLDEEGDLFRAFIAAYAYYFHAALHPMTPDDELYGIPAPSDTNFIPNEEEVYYSMFTNAPKEVVHSIFGYFRDGCVKRDILEAVEPFMKIGPASLPEVMAAIA